MLSAPNGEHKNESTHADKHTDESMQTSTTADMTWGSVFHASIAAGSALLPIRLGEDKDLHQQAEEEITSSTNARNTISNNDLAAVGITPTQESFALDPNDASVPKTDRRCEPPTKHEPDFFSSLSSYPELLMELATHLAMPSFISLYSISKDFHGAIDGHLSHTLCLAASRQASEAHSIFPFTLFGSLCIPDPIGRLHPRNPHMVRKVPSLRWLQMVVHREKVVRDILAYMARQGHRMPKGMSLSLKKMWLVMDISTNAGRVQFMHNTTFFTAVDLYQIQLFIVKLDMRFNDPIDGPGDDALRKLFLGQRGLTTLRNCLKRTHFTCLNDLVRLIVRYNYTPEPEHRHLSIWGVPPHEIGIGHLEGWGKGRVHLLRPDELVVREAVRRQLDLKNHIMGMMLWGYVDMVTGEDTPATDDEKYISDDEDMCPEGWSDYHDQVTGDDVNGSQRDETMTGL